MKNPTIAQSIDWAMQELADGESPRIDVKVLLCDVLSCNSARLISHPEQILTETQKSQFKSYVLRRQAGEPVSYITGTQGFWDLSLKVNKKTLIPRPETEILVEVALDIAAKNIASVAGTEKKPLKILDLGTGTGAITLALGKEITNSYVLGVDRIPEAIALAQENARLSNITNVEFLQSVWFDAIPQQHFDLIVTNPPYVETDSKWLNEGDVRFEPQSALTSGIDGLDDIRLIIEQAQHWLTPEGWLLIEHGVTQCHKIKQLLELQQFQSCSSVKDFNRLPRVSFAQKRVAEVPFNG